MYRKRLRSIPGYISSSFTRCPTPKIKLANKNFLKSRKKSQIASFASLSLRRPWHRSNLKFTHIVFCKAINELNFNFLLYNRAFKSNFDFYQHVGHKNSSLKIALLDLLVSLIQAGAPFSDFWCYSRTSLIKI